MSTTSPEPKKYVNSDLTWKKIVKGSRSARKPVARNLTMGMELSDSNSRASDTEKHGVAILGRRFSGKIEHVPIKKRRFMLRSPSPPPQNPHLCLDAQEMILDKKQRRGIGGFPKKVIKTSGNKFNQGEDFSGIEILADVACNNSMISDGDHDEEKLQVEDLKCSGVDLTTSAMSSDQTTVTAKGLVDECKNEDTSAGNSLTNLRKGLRKMEESALSQDDKFPWDLNVLHAEEQPFDSVTADSAANVEQSSSLIGREGQLIRGSPEIHGGTGYLRSNARQIVVLSEKNGDCHKSDVTEALCHKSLGVGNDGIKSDSDHGINCNGEECVPASTGYGQGQESSTSSVVDPKASKEIVYIGFCDDRQVLPERNKASPPLDFMAKQNIEACSSDVQQKNDLSMESKKADTFNVMSSPAPKLEKIVHEISFTIVKENGAYSGAASGSHEGEGRPVVAASLDVQPGSQVEDSNDNNCSSGRGDNAPTVVAKVDDQAVVAVTSKEKANEDSVAAVEATSPALALSEEVMQKSSVDSSVTGRGMGTINNTPSSNLVKVVTDDPSDDSYQSELCQADKLRVVANDNIVDVPPGYDFEDGELRESDAHYYWDKNGEDGEVEHLDYGSDSEDLRHFGTENEDEIKLERGMCPESATADALRDDSVSPKTRTSDLTTDYPAGVSGSRAIRTGLLSHGEGSDSTHKDFMTRSRAEGFYEWEGKDTGSKRFPMRNGIISNFHGKGLGGRFYVNRSTAYRGSDRHYSPSYSSSYPSESPRQRNFMESRRHLNPLDHMGNDTGRFAGYDGRMRRQFTHPTSHDVSERNIRKSPTNRDNAHGTRAGILPLRDISPARNQFRRYPQGAGRGTRGEYHRPMFEEGTGYGNHTSHRLIRRERSISPVGRRRSQYSITYKKTESRSRSRSPYTYGQPRERQSRPRSRSPVIRSNARMERVHIQKHYTGTYEEQGFTSPPRNHFSPRRSSRWFDDRNGGLDNFRGRRSPVRMFRQGQRFDPGRFLRRISSNDEFRPVMQSKKFPDMGTAARREEYEDSAEDDRRKHSNRYEMVPRVRRHDIEGSVQRFRINADGSLNAEESFVDTDSYNHDNCDRVNDKRSREVSKEVGKSSED